METAQREMSFLLAGPERRLLRWTAARLPASWMPDHLTIIGVLGALTIGAGYALCSRHPAWLWLSSFGLAVNWFGDSLDGTLARVRHIERPKYGYYLDHMVDAINTSVVGIGLGLSPYVPVWAALGLVIVYLCLSINVYLESSALGVFDLGFGVFGPTEARALLVLANTALFAWLTLAHPAAVTVTRLATIVVAGASVGMAYAVLARMRINLIRLARLEPPRRG